MHTVDYMDGVRVDTFPRIKRAHKRAAWLRMPSLDDMIDTALITSTITLLAAIVWVKG
jgi:hypothetical protein